MTFFLDKKITKNSYYYIIYNLYKCIKMPEYIINDDWILQRISKESNSFSEWAKNLVASITKSIEESRPEVADELKKSKQDLPDLVELEEQMKRAEKSLTKFSDNLQGLGSLGGYISGMVGNIQSKLTEKLRGSIPGFEIGDMNIDFVTGKRKSLSSALYDVAKERGITSEGILYLIHSLPDLESFLYSTSAGKYYRDHTEHQLRVAVLGDFLLEQDLGLGNLLKHISDITKIDKEMIKDQIWWVMGLIHDIGYPMQKMTKSINYSLLNQILKCYPMLDFDVIPFEISLSNKNLEPYIKLLEEGLSKDAKLLIRSGSGLDFDSLRLPEIQHFHDRENVHTTFEYESKISLDHGVVGALSLLKSLGTPEEIKQNSDELEGYIKAAQAISIHNFKDQLKDYVFENNPLAFLLILIDEMQEWGRPVPIQIRETYFTTELKKITLLDEIHLTIDEVQWLMAYKKMEAKKLTNFQFQLFCNAKSSAFGRLHRGKEFPKTRIVIQDYETELPKKDKVDQKRALEDLTSKVITQIEESETKDKAIKIDVDKKELRKLLKSRDPKDQKKALAIMKADEKELGKIGKDMKPKIIEKLFAEFYIVI